MKWWGLISETDIFPISAGEYVRQLPSVAVQAKPDNLFERTYYVRLSDYAIYDEPRNY